MADKSWCLIQNGDLTWMEDIMLRLREFRVWGRAMGWKSLASKSW